MYVQVMWNDVHQGEFMSKLSFERLLLSAAAVAALVVTPANAEPKKITITGQVFDSACLFVRNLKTPIGNQCALECAAGGSPLVILGDDGNVYWPIDTAMPSKGQNARLVKFAGKAVKASGMVYERGGSKALAIETISEAKGTAR